jgi:hypothetical protein
VAGRTGKGRERRGRSRMGHVHGRLVDRVHRRLTLETGQPCRRPRDSTGIMTDLRDPWQPESLAPCRLRGELEPTVAQSGISQLEVCYEPGCRHLHPCLAVARMAHTSLLAETTGRIMATVGGLGFRRRPPELEVVVTSGGRHFHKADCLALLSFQ